MNKYWLETSKETERAIALCCTGSTIVSILAESHQDISAIETLFWTCCFPLWCNSCGDTKKTLLHVCICRLKVLGVLLMQAQIYVLPVYNAGVLCCFQKSVTMRRARLPCTRLSASYLSLTEILWPLSSHIYKGLYYTMPYNTTLCQLLPLPFQLKLLWIFFLEWSLLHVDTIGHCYWDYSI